MSEKMTITGIKVEFTTMVREFVAGVNRKGKLVVMPGSLNPYFFDGDMDPETAIRQVMSELGYSPVREWFEDGGATYQAKYPGKDVLGRRFEAGTTIIRKKRQNLIA